MKTLASTLVLALALSASGAAFAADSMMAADPMKKAAKADCMKKAAMETDAMKQKDMSAKCGHADAMKPDAMSSVPKQ